MKIKTAKFVASKTDDKGVITNVEGKVMFDIPETLKDIQSIKGYSESALASVVGKYLIAHVSQTPVKKKMLETGKALEEVQELFFPTGVRGEGKKVENAYYAIAREQLGKLDASARKKKEQELNKTFADVEIPEGEENPGIFLFSLELRKRIEG